MLWLFLQTRASLKFMLYWFTFLCVYLLYYGVYGQWRMQGEVGDVAISPSAWTCLSYVIRNAEIFAALIISVTLWFHAATDLNLHHRLNRWRLIHSYKVLALSQFDIQCRTHGEIFTVWQFHINAILGRSSFKTHITQYSVRSSG